MRRLRKATCQRCRTEFETHNVPPRGKFCSRQCFDATRATVANLSDRFWAKVQKTDGCWLWTGNRMVAGYGVMTVTSGKKDSAHRTSFQLHFGAIPEGMFVCHRCDNPPCVRPDHLFLGTVGDNSADMVAKGRQAAGARNGVVLHPEAIRRGEANHSAKLTVADVAAIRTRHATGLITQRGLAREYGIDQSQISRLLRGKAWAV